MKLQKNEWPVVIIVVLALIAFTFYFVLQANYEFLVYDGLILLLMILMLVINRWLNLPTLILWGLGLWAILHMSGGGVHIGGKRLFDMILIPISEEYEIFKYDQLLHFYGYFMTTFVLFYMLKPLLKGQMKSFGVLSVVLVMASLGLGAFYEIIEFSTTVLFDSTGVGGYVNNSLDLVFDLLGAILAMVLIRCKLVGDLK